SISAKEITMGAHEGWLWQVCCQLSQVVPLDSPRAADELGRSLEGLVRAAFRGRGQPGVVGWVGDQVWGGGAPAGRGGPPRGGGGAAAGGGRSLARKLGEWIRDREGGRAAPAWARETTVGP